MTESDYATRKKRMASLLSDDMTNTTAVPKEQRTAQETTIEQIEQPHTPPKPPIVTTRVPITIQVTLADIEIDPGQPRQFLPADLRRALTQGRMSYSDVLAQLQQRTANGDTEAKAYVDDVRGLADDIKANGLLSSIMAYSTHAPDGRTRYRLIDGERRFWAHVYLSAEPGSDVTAVRAEVHDELEHASADEIVTMQWSANMQRESVCAVDIAEFVYQKREEAVRSIRTDSTLLTQWGTKGKPASPRDAAQQIVCQALAHTFGRPLKRRAYYQYLSLTEKLSAPVKALARAHKMSLGRLIQITSQPEREQMAAILRMIESECVPEDAPAKPEGQPRRPGRPTRPQSRITLAERAVAGMDGDTEQVLLNWSRDDLTAVLQKDRDLLEATDRHLRLVQAALSRL